MAVYITGDTHGDFRQIREFCVPMGTKREDIMIVLGDSGLNYFGDERDDVRKRIASRNNVTYLIIHGNHEMRPESTGKLSVFTRKKDELTKALLQSMACPKPAFPNGAVNYAKNAKQAPKPKQNTIT